MSTVIDILPDIDVGSEILHAQNTYYTQICFIEYPTFITPVQDVYDRYLLILSVDHLQASFFISGFPNQNIECTKHIPHKDFFIEYHTFLLHKIRHEDTWQRDA